MPALRARGVRAGPWWKPIPTAPSRALRSSAPASRHFPDAASSRLSVSAKTQGSLQNSRDLPSPCELVSQSWKRMPAVVQRLVLPGATPADCARLMRLEPQSSGALSCAERSRQCLSSSLDLLPNFAAKGNFRHGQCSLPLAPLRFGECTTFRFDLTVMG